MNIYFATIAAGALLGTGMGTANVAQAEEGKNPISITLSAGSLGAGPEVGYRMSDHIGLRGGASFFGVGANFGSDNLEYRGDIQLKSYGAMLDLYPFGGRFRLSGGARINHNHVDVYSAPDGIVTFNGRQFTPEQIGTLSSGADFKRFSPAITMGVGGKNRKGLVLNADAGVLLQGASQLRPLKATGQFANHPRLLENLEAERRSLQKDLNKIHFYPIVQIALGYRF